MATALDLDTVTQALKEHYKPLTVKNMVYKDNPLLALMPKYEKFGGENMPIPVQYGITNRRSANFGQGQLQDTATSLARFVITRVKNYSFASITGETIKATEGNADAFLKYATLEIDGALQSLTRSLAINLYGDSSGSLGAVTNPSGSVLKFNSPDQVTNAEVGMTVTFAPDTSSDLRKNGGSSVFSTTITAVDREDGEITVGGVPSDFVANDLVIPQGDYAYDSSPIIRQISGLEAWLPATAPTSALFFGQDRSSDPTRLGGIRFDGSSMPIEEALLSGAVRTAREGGSPEYCFMNYANYANLEKALGSKVVYDKVSSDDADVGFQALSIIGPKGSIKVIPDQNCTPDVAYLLQMDTWSLNSLGAAPHFLDLDGNRMLRESAADAYEVRMGFYGNVACNAPGYNCRIKLA